MKVLVIEPCYFGLGYLKALKEMSIPCVVATSDAHFPELHGYRHLVEHIVVCDVSNAELMQSALQSIGQLELVTAVVSGNQFVTESTAQFAALRGLRGLSITAASFGVHKDKARAAYQAFGAPSLQFSLVNSPSTALAEAQRIGYPLIVKPTSAASSKGVSLAHDEAELQTALESLSQMNFGVFGLEHRDEVLLEEFADGAEFSVELALDNKEVCFAGVTEKWVTAPPYFVELGHVHPARISSSQTEALIHAARQAADALELHTGIFHIELKWGKRGARIIECNPRPGGDHITTDLVPLATGVRLFELHLDLLLQRPRLPKTVSSNGAAVGFIVAPEAGVLRELDGWDAVQNLPYVVRCVLEKKPGDTIRPPQSSADRIAYIIVTGEDNQQAADNLLAAMRMLSVRITSMEVLNES